jgi:hypothetical protein
MATYDGLLPAKSIYLRDWECSNQQGTDSRVAILKIPIHNNKSSRRNRAATLWGNNSYLDGQPFSAAEIRSVSGVQICRTVLCVAASWSWNETQVCRECVRKISHPGRKRV